MDAFRQGLRALGYVEGQDIIIEQRHAAGVATRLPDLATELVRLKVEVIVVDGTLAVRAARAASASTPIVFTLVSDPVASGFVTSLARPGGTMTGQSILGVDLAAKRLQLLREAVPGASRVAVLADPTNGGATVPQVSEARAAAPALGTRLLIHEAAMPDQLPGVFVAMSRERAGAVMTLTSPMFFSQRARIVELAAEKRLPAMFPEREFVDAGGLMSYGVSFSVIWRRAASYVDRILKGAKPGDLPVELPTKFELVINLKTAKVLGLTIPPSVLARADQMIE